MKVPSPHLVVQYEGRDISVALAPMLIELNYSDFMEGESDTVDLVVENTDGLWLDAWYPRHGDNVNVQLGYADGPMLKGGDFEVDEIELDGPPDVIKIKGVAMGVKRSVRTFKGRGFVNTTLANIAATIAQRNKLKLEGKIEPIRINNAVQSFETDLSFLKRLAESYGYAFSVRGSRLVFFRRAALKAADPVLTLGRSDVTRFRFRDKVHGVVTAVLLTYHDAHSKSLRTRLAKDATARTNRTSANQLRLNVRAENDQQAQLIANAALDRANEDQTGASLTLPGNVKLVAGLNIMLDGFGQMDGKYTITQSRHRVSRSSGYSTEIDLKRVRDPALGAKR